MVKGTKKPAPRSGFFRALPVSKVLHKFSDTRRPRKLAWGVFDIRWGQTYRWI